MQAIEIFGKIEGSDLKCAIALSTDLKLHMTVFIQVGTLGLAHANYD
jgi:hypothetical protein